MACACQNGSKKETWTVSTSSGTKTYSSEIEAKAAAQAAGTTAKKQ